MKRLKTLRIRFALWISGLFLLILTGFSVYVYANMAVRLYAAVDDSLALNASQVSAALNIDNGQLILPDSFIETPENSDLRTRGFTIQIISPQGKTLQAFGPYHFLPFPPVDLIQKPFFNTTLDTSSNNSIRVYTTRVEDNNQLIAFIQVAQSLQSTSDALQNLLFTLLVSVPLLVVVAGFSGYFLAGRALAPIDSITNAARRISADDLSKRLDLPATDDEVGRLAQTFNEMLTRLDGSFRRERQFTADASHELRTPVAAMQAILSVIREKPRTPIDYQEALADLSDEADRLQMLIGNLLGLAHGETKKKISGESVDLSALLMDVSDSMAPLAEEKGLTITNDIEDSLRMQGDSDGLIRMFVNLLDNAIKYTEQGNISLAATKSKDGFLQVTIKDTGIGVSPENLPLIFDRFYRVSKSRTTRGAGLGLAIASEIAQSHGGSIKVESEEGKGSVFIVRLRNTQGNEKFDYNQLYEN